MSDSGSVSREALELALRLGPGSVSGLALESVLAWELALGLGSELGLA